LFREKGIYIYSGVFIIKELILTDLVLIIELKMRMIILKLINNIKRRLAIRCFCSTPKKGTIRNSNNMKI
tara:strand:- start:489 stop:698 length:210 start_codon:yes stop_codon:yes gene_type:complete